MVKASTRPMSAQERRQLRASVSGQGADEWVINIVFGATALVLPTMLVTWLLGQRHLQQVLLPVAAGIGAAGGLYFQVKARRFLASANAATRADIQNGVVEEIEATIQEAVWIPEFEDEGPALFLALSPEATLFLQGQYLYEIGNRGERLRSRVRITRAPLSRTVLEFSTSGDAIGSMTSLPAGLYSELPEDGGQLGLTLQDALARYATMTAARHRGRRRTRGRS